MKKIILLSLVLGFSIHTISSQTSTYWVVFKDKNNSPYSLTKPSAYLSEKALTRRQRQHIPISQTDLPVNPQYINQVKALGVMVMHQSKWFNAVNVSSADTMVMNEIRNLNCVQKVILLSSPSSKPTSPKYKDEAKSVKPISVQPIEKSIQSNVFDYGPSLAQAHQLGMDCMHNRGFQGQGMTIAYMDDGFYRADSLAAFDSLRANNQILGTYDFVTNNTYVYHDDDINLSHGMNTLSCSAGNLPGRIVGTAPKAHFWLFVTEAYYSESWQEETNWAVAAEFADSVGVDVINTSLGYSINMTNSAENHSYSDMDGRTTIISKAAALAARKGMAVVVSAGNSGGAPWYKITAPADADSILTVGAVDSLGFIVGFSSRGPTYDGRIKPSVCARGLDAVVASPFGDVWNESGTSFSSPITAGAVACLWQAHPNANNIQVINAVMQSASQYTFPDTIQGYGIPNFCIADSILTSMVGIHEAFSNSTSLHVFPNPFHSAFTISLYADAKQNVQVELFDISGRTVLKQERKLMPSNNVFSIDELSTIEPGIYLLKITSTDSVITEKIIKQ